MISLIVYFLSGYILGKLIGYYYLKYQREKIERQTDILTTKIMRISEDVTYKKDKI